MYISPECLIYCHTIELAHSRLSAVLLLLSAVRLVNCLAIIHLWPSYLWPSYLSPSTKKIIAVAGGNAHAIMPGYMSIDANPAVSEPQKHGSC